MSKETKEMVLDSLKNFVTTREPHYDTDVDKAVYMGEGLLSTVESIDYLNKACTHIITTNKPGLSDLTNTAKELSKQLNKTHEGWHYPGNRNSAEPFMVRDIIEFIIEMRVKYNEFVFETWESKPTDNYSVCMTHALKSASEAMYNFACAVDIEGGLKYIKV